MYKVSDFLIYCLWIWIFTILNLLDFINYSLLYSSFFGLLFTIYNTFFVVNNNLLQDRIIIVLIEIIVLCITIYKHFVIDNKKLFDVNDIIFNILLFIVYLLFIGLMGKSFYGLYFVEYRNKN